MDRKVLFAAVLMMVILAVYQFFAPPPPRVARPATGADSSHLAREAVGQGAPAVPDTAPGQAAGAGGAGSGTAGPAGSLAGLDAAGIAGGAVGAGGEGTPGGTRAADSIAWGDPAAAISEVTVENPLFHAVFSTQGAVIRSWKLKEFGGPAGEPAVELVPPESEGGLNLVLETPTGRIDFSRVHFRASANSLTLDPAHRSGNLTFEAPGPGGALVREVLTFSDDSYSFGLDIQVLDAQGRPYLGTERASVEWLPGIDLTEPDVDSEVMSIGAVASIPGQIERLNLRHFRRAGTPIERRGAVDWAALRNKYFLVAMVPATPGKLDVGFSGNVDRARMSMLGGLPSLSEIAAPAGAPAAGLHPGDVEIYLGPMDYRLLAGYGRGLQHSVDFGWRWIQPLSRATHWMLIQIHRVIPNWGLAIILLAALAKLLFHPLTDRSVRSTRAMQRIQPQLAEIREKYKNDPQKQQREMMKLYREAGVNPVGGCLPLLVQSPVFMALFQVLQHAIELRQAPFILWIHDLSTQDALFSFSAAIPFLGHKFNLLPILMGASMYWQQKTSTPHGTPVDPRSQAQMMGYIMPPMMTIMFYRFPSGLVIYWIVNTVLTIAHQHYLNRDERGKTAETPDTPKKRRRRRGRTVVAGREEGTTRAAMTAGMNSSEK